jgi:hypothetical protein
MMALIVTLALALIATAILKHFHFVPDTEELRVAGLAAGDEGHDIFQDGVRLTEIATSDKETILAYATVALPQQWQTRHRADRKLGRLVKVRSLFLA